ncbi:MAG: c-type cytochrome domain-containing protein, partial [Planctomycetota bacterium]
MLALAGFGLWGLRAQQKVSFSRDVQPILTENCFKCHGEALQLSGLDLRSRATMLKGGQKGPAVVPGKADLSRLYKLVSAQEKPSMPLDGKLTDAQVATLREWINQGAVWEGAETVKAPATTAATASLEDMQIPAEA